MEQIDYNLPLLSLLPRKQIRQAFEEGGITLQKYLDGMILYHQKELCHTVDLIVSGKFVALSYGGVNVHGGDIEYSAGQLVGERLLFGKSRHYPHTICCVEKGKVLRFEKQTVMQFLLYEDFAKAFGEIMSAEIGGEMAQPEISDKKSLRENLLSYLYQQTQTQKKHTIYLPVSKKELADILGVERPSLFRELKKLKDEGVLEISDRIVIMREQEINAPRQEDVS